MLGGELDVGAADWELQYLRSNLVDLQVSVSADAPTLEEYKHSASVQSLLLLLETGWWKKAETQVIEQLRSWCSQNGRPPSSLKNAQLQFLPLSLQIGS